MTQCKKFTAYLTALVLVCALCSTTVFADRVYEGDHDGYDEYHDLHDPYSGVYLSKKSGTMTLKISETVDMPTEMIFDYRSGAVTWASNKPEIAFVNAQGLVTAKEPGSANIVATYSDTWGQTRTNTMQVKVKAATVPNGEFVYSLALEEGEIVHGQELVFPGYSGPVKWATSDAKIAVVDTKGKITAEDFGKCTITAIRTDGNGNEIVREIAVRSIFSTQHLDKPFTVTLAVGTSCDLRKALHPLYMQANTYGALELSSSKTGVVSVNEGILTAKSAGTGTITVTHTDPSTHSETRRKVQVKVLAATE